MKDRILLLDAMLKDVKIAEEHRKNNEVLTHYKVEKGSIIKHETGEIGVVLYALGGNLFVLYLNYDHVGYHLKRPFEKISRKEMREILKLKSWTTN